MKVFIIGVTGIIGKSVAKKYVCEGYEVYGLSRKKEKKKDLLEEEIIPIIGDINDIDSWFKEVEDCNIFINCYTYFENDSNRIFKKIINLSKKKESQKIIYIFTSGLWVYGNRPNEIIFEDDKLDPPKFVQWCPEHEKDIIENDFINGIIIRPAMVYGREGSVLRELFKQVSKGNLRIYGDKNTNWSVVHVDDLAPIYIDVIKNLNISTKQIFNVANTKSENVYEIVLALIDKFNKKANIEFVNPNNEYEECFTMTTLISNKKITELFNWKQKKKSITDGLQQYYFASLAAYNK